MDSLNLPGLKNHQDQDNQKLQFPISYKDYQLCEEFQKRIDVKYIKKVWEFLSESNQNNETQYYKGRKLISKAKVKNLFDIYTGKEFTQVIEAINNRFQCLEMPEYIDIQDLVISLTILGRMSDENKLRLIFDLTDVDQDECLSIEDIRSMIRRIQRNFAKEMTFINVDSSVMLYELALITAERKFQITVEALNRKNNVQRQLQKIDDANNDENRFISWNEFNDCLQEQVELKKGFLPNNYLLSDVLKNTFQEKEFNLTPIEINGAVKLPPQLGREKQQDQYYTKDQLYNMKTDEFVQFRKMLHFGLRKHYKEKDYLTYIDPQKGVPLPGKINKQNISVQQQQMQQQQSQSQSLNLQNRESVSLGHQQKAMFEVEKFNDIAFKSNLDELNVKRMKMIQSEAQKKIEKIIQDEQKQKMMTKETNQTNNYSRHKQRVQEMINFNKDPKYNENFFKKQIDQMKQKHSKLVKLQATDENKFNKTTKN